MNEKVSIDPNFGQIPKTKNKMNFMKKIYIKNYVSYENIICMNECMNNETQSMLKKMKLMVIGCGRTYVTICKSAGCLSDHTMSIIWAQIVNLLDYGKEKCVEGMHMICRKQQFDQLTKPKPKVY